MGFLKKLFKYGITTPWYIVQAVTGLLMTKLLLKALKFTTFRSLYNKMLYTSNYKFVSQHRFDVLTYSIDATAILFSSTCLQKSLLLKYFLRKDKAYKIIIGIPHSSLSSMSFTAHAWIEKTSIKVYGDLPDEKLTPLWEWGE
jgi:hypothetical protein